MCPVTELTRLQAMDAAELRIVFSECTPISNKVGVLAGRELVVLSCEEADAFRTWYSSQAEHQHHRHCMTGPTSA